MKRLITICAVLLFAANVYAADVLVYDGEGSQSNIEGAMTRLGIDYDLRNPGTPVTAGDLDTHNVLVIGWNIGGNMSGVPATVLADGITGRILLTGHDADVHAVRGYDYGDPDPLDAVQAAALAFLGQAISFAQGGGGTGLVALGDYSTAFGYLPAAWGITATGGFSEETITSFTPKALSSGVYDGLTPADMSNWGQSYHTSFDSWGAGFVPFELDDDDEQVVTIARYPLLVEKELVEVLDLDADGVVEVGEPTGFFLRITVTNGTAEDIESIVVKDRLGGDLEFVDASPYPDTVDTKGNSEKVFLEWELGTLAGGASTTIDLLVATDINPGNSSQKNPKPGKQEYTSEGEKVLNSGANAKGILLGYQVSDSSESIIVEVFPAD
ncbi:MAG: hypothetical protein ACYS74_10860 [Planctomycetota bacterium]|jgi:hypothetical protein